MRQKGSIICKIFKITYVRFIFPLCLHLMYVSPSKKAFLISVNESRKMIVQYPPKDSKRFSLLPCRQSGKDCASESVGPSLPFQDPGRTELSFSASHPEF